MGDGNNTSRCSKPAAPKAAPDATDKKGSGIAAAGSQAVKKPAQFLREICAIPVTE